MTIRRNVFFFLKFISLLLIAFLLGTFFNLGEIVIFILVVVAYVARG